MYHVRFYIIDLSKQLELKFAELKSTQTDVLKLYRGQKLSRNEVANLMQNIGNLISTNGYLSTSRLRSVAYTFAKKRTNRVGVVVVLFEYQVDLNQVKKIVIADIAPYSAFPKEAEMLVDIGKFIRETRYNLYRKVRITEKYSDFLIANLSRIRLSELI